MCCDLCGADDAEPLLALRDRMFETATTCFQIVRCRACGLIYLNPRPALHTIDRYYQETYAPFARSGIAGRVKRWTTARAVDSLWPLLEPPARVIDVGCATGELLQAVRERGNPNVLGIEPNAHAANTAHERWGIEVVSCTLEQANLPAGSADTVLMAHTIEHLPSPTTTLREIHRVLKPGGHLVLWLPNAGSLAADTLGQWWIGWDAPRHFYDFTPATLGGLLQKTGFTTTSIDHEMIGLEWSWALRLLARERLRNHLLDRVLAALHPILTAALTPVAASAAAAHRAGRIRVVATQM